jgi:hypothetical protein
METEKELVEALDETKESLLDEAQDLKSRADDLEWEVIEEIFKRQGYSKESLEVEKRCFRSMQRTANFLANYK